MRKTLAAASESADGSVSASEHEQSSSQADVEAELVSEQLAGGSSTAGSAAGSLAAEDSETTEHVTEDDATDRGAADEPPPDDLASLQPGTAGSDEAAASDCEDEGETAQPELPASQQPFLLEMHSNARPDGMVRHQSSGTASCCRFEKRRDGLIQRDVLYNRADEGMPPEEEKFTIRGVTETFKPSSSGSTVVRQIWSISRQTPHVTDLEQHWRLHDNLEPQRTCFRLDDLLQTVEQQGQGLPQKEIRALQRVHKQCMQAVQHDLKEAAEAVDTL